MLLAVDIGNSNITFGLFNEDILINTVSFSYSKNMSLHTYSEIFKQFLDNMNFSECVVASVADEITPTVCDAIAEVFNVKPIILDNSMNLGIGIKSKTPQNIGIDRIANVCAVSEHYSEPVIVVDFGTATTFDIMDDKKNFAGGIIMPGIGTQLKSLETNTSKLPHIELKELANGAKTINTDTKKAILTGVVQGHAHAVEGLLSDCIKEMGKKPVLVATGGYAELITKYIKKYKFDIVDITLTIKGLKFLYKLNSD